MMTTHPCHDDQTFDNNHRLPESNKSASGSLGFRSRGCNCQLFVNFRFVSSILSFAICVFTFIICYLCLCFYHLLFLSLLLSFAICQLCICVFFSIICYCLTLYLLLASHVASFPSSLSKIIFNIPLFLIVGKPSKTTTDFFRSSPDYIPATF